MKLPWGAGGRMQEGDVPTPCAVCDPKPQLRSRLHTTTHGYKPGCSNRTGTKPQPRCSYPVHKHQTSVPLNSLFLLMHG